MKKIIISTIMAAMTAIPGMALDLNLSVAGDGLRVLTAKEAPEGFGRGLPMGPEALHFASASLWVVDSISGRLLQFDATGKEANRIDIKDADQLVIADFAPFNDSEGKPAGFWVLGSEKAEIIKVGLEGKILASFSTELSIQSRLELLPDNRLAVLDEGMSEFAIFAATGKLLCKQPCIGKGIVADRNGDIMFLQQDGATVRLLKRINASGQIEKVAELPVGIDAHPSLVLGLASNEILFSFHSLNEEKETMAFNISRMNTDGRVSATMTTAFPASFIGRPVISDGKNLLLISFVEENGKYILRLSDFTPSLIKEASEG